MGDTLKSASENPAASTPMKCLFVYPKFTSTSFWNYLPTCDLVDAKYPAAPLGLVTVAAMLPKEWDVRLIDTNAKELLDEDIDAFFVEGVQNLCASSDNGAEDALDKFRVVELAEASLCPLLRSEE